MQMEQVLIHCLVASTKMELELESFLEVSRKTELEPPSSVEASTTMALARAVHSYPLEQRSCYSPIRSREPNRR